MGKQRKIEIHIPNPCKRDWDKMTPEGKGRHCSQCSKTIIDVTNYSDKELLAFFEKAKGKICGRFSETQLNRIIEVQEYSGTPFIHKLLVGASLAASVAAIGQTQNNTSNHPPGSNQTVKKNFAEEKKPPTGTLFQISGKIIDSVSKEPLYGVFVALKLEDSYYLDAFTNWNGEFSFNIDNSVIGRQLTISLIEDGYFDKKIYFKVEEFPVQLPILTMLFKDTLSHSSAPHIMGRTVVTQYIIDGMAVTKDQNIPDSTIINVPEFDSRSNYIREDLLFYPINEQKDINPKN